MINARKQGQYVCQELHSSAIVVILLQSQALVPTNMLSLLLDKNFYFELVQQPRLSLFAHLISHNTKSILVQNELNLPVQIPRKLRLGMVTKIPFDNHFNATVETILTVVPPSNLLEPQ